MHTVNISFTYPVPHVYCKPWILFNSNFDDKIYINVKYLNVIQIFTKFGTGGPHQKLSGELIFVHIGSILLLLYIKLKLNFITFLKKKDRFY
jgi:hypothetical protein